VSAALSTRLPKLTEVDVPARLREALDALHAAEKRQLTLAGTAKLASAPRRRLLFDLLQHMIDIHHLASSPSDGQWSLLEAHCADTSILLPLLAARP